MDLLLDVICVVNREGRFLSVSAASEQVFGYRPEEMVGRSAFEFMHPNDQARIHKLIERINAGEAAPDHENRYIHKQGHIVHIMWSTRWFEAEQVRVGVARDISKRKQAEARQAAVYAISEAAHSDDALPQLYQRIHELTTQLLPADSFLVALYDAASDLLSYPYQVTRSSPPLTPGPLAACTPLDQVVQHNRPLLLTPDSARQHQATVQHWLGVPITADGTTLGALVAQNHSGTLRYSEQDQAFLLFVASQLATAIVRRRTQAHLAFLAQHDQLTQLANRGLFMDRLQGALQRAKRGALQLAVLYLDMDSFKQINDTYGHATGDQLLREVALRLRQCVRDSDTVSRLGGDEFAVLLDSITHPDDAALVASKIQSTLGQAYQWEGVELRSTPSIGIATYPAHGQSEQELLRQADQAMYQAKRSGGAGHAFAPGTELCKQS